MPLRDSTETIQELHWRNALWQYHGFRVSWDLEGGRPWCIADWIFENIESHKEEKENMGENEAILSEKNTKDKYANGGTEGSLQSVNPRPEEPVDLKHKEGDKVKVHTLDWFQKHALKDNDGDFYLPGDYNPVYFVRDMLSLCSRELIISTVKTDSYTCEESGIWDITDWMLEDTESQEEEEDMKERSNIGDISVEESMQGPSQEGLIRQGAMQQVLKGGMKFDEGKPDWSLIDLNVIEEMVRVLTYAATHKYSRDNWKQVHTVRYFAALMRHLARIQHGEVRDKDDGLPSVAHLMCNAYFIAAKDYYRRNPDVKVNPLLEVIDDKAE
jgi:hypothetical protein